MALSDIVKTLLGFSAYQSPGPQGYGPRIEDPDVKRIRSNLGGNIQSLPTTKLRWYLEDLERAQEEADGGHPTTLARLYRAMRRDGVFAGLLGSRAAGLIRKPKRFYGSQKVADSLRARNGTRSIFDEMFPPSELALLNADGIMCGFGVAEMVPVRGRDFPVMVRLEPEFARYIWNENQWYFTSVAGRLPIVPGDGRWIFHVPGGRLTPWNSGLWPSCGEAFINKQHAKSYRSNYCAKLANPARVATAALGATEAQRMGFFKRLMAWGINTVFELPPGWDVKLLESNGRGWEVFQRQIDTSDLEYMIALTGQMVTTTGGTGFANAEVPAAIRDDLVQSDGDALAYTINTQGLPQYILQHFGEDELFNNATIVEWDTGTPTDKEKQSRTLSQFGTAIQALTNGLAPYGKSVDIEELAERFTVPLRDEAVKLPETASDDAPSDNLGASVAVRDAA